MENIGTQTGMVASQVDYDEQCYSHIDNYTRRVRGFVTHRMCYIDSLYKYHHVEGQDISRCGQCLELIGPTQKPFYCVVAGTFKAKENANMTKSDLEKIVFINNFNYDYIATSVHGSINHATQVSVRVISCPYGSNPSLYVVSTDPISGTANVQPINTNVIHKEIIAGNVHYPILPNGTYTIPTHIKSLQLLSVNKERIGFSSLDLTKRGVRRVAETQFTNDTHPTRCDFIPQSVLFGPSVTKPEMSSPVNRFFTWDVKFQSVTDGEYAEYPIFNRSAITVQNGVDQFIVFSYPSIFKFGVTFKRAQLAFTHDSLDFSLTEPLVQIMDYNGVANTVHTTICNSAIEEVTHPSTGHTTVIISFPSKNCTRYGLLTAFTTNSQPSQCHEDEGGNRAVNKFIYHRGSAHQK